MYLTLITIQLQYVLEEEEKRKGYVWKGVTTLESGQHSYKIVIFIHY